MSTSNKRLQIPPFLRFEPRAVAPNGGMLDALNRWLILAG